MKLDAVMSKTKPPKIVAYLDARLKLMTPAQKKRFLRYRRPYILADKLALPFCFLSIGLIAAFPYWAVAVLAYALLAPIVAVHVLWHVAVFSIFKRLDALEENTTAQEVSHG